MISCVTYRIKNLFNLKDKAGRLDYFCVQLTLIISLFAFVIIGGQLQSFQVDQFVPLYLLLTIIISIFNSIQRMNSIGIKRLFFLLILIPVVGQLFQIYLIFPKQK